MADEPIAGTYVRVIFERVRSLPVKKLPKTLLTYLETTYFNGVTDFYSLCPLCLLRRSVTWVRPRTRHRESRPSGIRRYFGTRLTPDSVRVLQRVHD